MSRCDCAAKDYAYCEECQPHRFEPAPLPSSGDDAGVGKKDPVVARMDAALLIADELCDKAEVYVAAEQASREAGDGIECERVTDAFHEEARMSVGRAFALGLAAGRAAERKKCMTAVADVDAADRCQLAMREKCADAIAARAGGTK